MSRTVVAVVIAIGGFGFVVVGGLSAPPAVVYVGMGLYVAAVGEMVRRLRAGDPTALAVPAVFVAGWLVVLFLGMLLLGWVP